MAPGLGTGGAAAFPPPGKVAPGPPATSGPTYADVRHEIAGRVHDAELRRGALARDEREARRRINREIDELGRFDRAVIHAERRHEPPAAELMKQLRKDQQSGPGVQPTYHAPAAPG